MRRFGIIYFLVHLVLLLFAAACTAPAPRETYASLATGPTTEKHLHVVRYRGETLGLIAKWYTGKVKNWERLKRANPDLDVNRLLLGDKVYIPKYLLTNTGPLPEYYVNRRSKLMASSHSARNTSNDKPGRLTQRTVPIVPKRTGGRKSQTVEEPSSGAIDARSLDFIADDSAERPAAGIDHKPGKHTTADSGKYLMVCHGTNCSWSKVN